MPLEPLEGRPRVVRRRRQRPPDTDGLGLRLLVRDRLLGDLITTPVPSETAVTVGSRTVLVGNSVYWFLFSARVGILEFDLDTESLSVIEVPSRAYADHRGLYLSTLAEDGGLGFIAMSMSGFTAQLWVRTTDDSGGADGWVQGQKIELDRLLSPVLGHVRGGSGV